MHKSLLFTFIFFVSVSYQDSPKKTDYNPLFFSMTNEWKNIKKDEYVFNFTVKSLDSNYDSQIDYNVRLLSNSKQEPLLFFSDIETSVCADGECKLANIKLYWNLLGNYVGYGIDPKLPLTKYEHDLFEKEDYAKLHQLLLDDNSILKRRKMSDLIDKVPVAKLNILSKEIDAVSGATKTEIREAVVKGGLYSCYTLWHIAHGEVQEKIKRYLQKLNSKELNQYFLQSPYKDYQLYALKQLNKAEFKEYSIQIINIFKNTDALTKIYILKKIPDNVLLEKRITNQFYKTFKTLDINSRTLLINKLKFANIDAIEILSKYTDSMTKNQLKDYLKYLNENPKVINHASMKNLLKSSKNKRFTYNYLIKDFLKKQ
jgi:hypothetical protein